MKPFRPIKLKKSYAIDFSPDDELFATLGRSNCWVWDIAKRKKISRSPSLFHPSTLKFSPSGNLLAVKNTSGWIFILDPKDCNILKDYHNYHDGEGSNILFSPCGSYLVDGSWSGHINVREVDTGKIVWSTIFENEIIAAVHQTMDGRRWVFEHHPIGDSTGIPPASTYFTLWKWPLDKNDYEKINLHVSLSKGSAITGDGEYLAVVHGRLSGKLDIIKVDSGNQIRSWPVEIGGIGGHLAWSNDGRFLGSVQTEKIVFYDGATYSKICEFQIPFLDFITFSPNSKYLGLGSWSDGMILSQENIWENARQRHGK